MARVFLLLLLVAAALGAAQTSDLHTTRAGEVIPTVTFSLNFPASAPEFYSVTIDAMGNAAYESHSAGKPDASFAEPYMIKFTASPETRKRVFELAKQSNYFAGSFDYTKGRIAHTGTKILRYRAPDANHESSFNWSQHPAVQELTNIFQGISTTLEFGRKLAYLHRHDRLGVEAELKHMEQAKKDGRLQELHVLERLLQAVANDPALMRVSRARATRLVEASR